jgi:signal transduction histidine kinase
MNDDRFEPRDEGQELTRFAAAKELLAAFSHTSAVGFGICDNQLRYQSINTALAASNGISVKAHLGRAVPDILGQVAESIEPALQHVLVTGEVVSRRIAGRLPTKQGMSYWIANYFPVKGAANKVRCTGAIAVEVTELRRLDEFLFKFTRDVPHNPDKESSRVARELHDSLTQYFIAVKNSLDAITQQLWQLDRGADEQLAPTIGLLDQRIMAMRTLVSTVANRFPIDRQS